MPEKKKYFNELNIFRGLIIIWVIIGHSYVSDSSIFGFLHDYAYSFHMNAFFMLSGFLMASKLKRCTDFKSSINLIVDRAKRLMVPYFFFTVITYILKMFLESYANNKLSSNIIVDVLLSRNNPNGGLWFLYALFIVSVFVVLLNKLNKFVLLAITIAMKIVLIYTNVPVPIIGYLLNRSMIVVIGIILFDYYEKIEAFFASNKKGTNIVLYAVGPIMLIASVPLAYLSKRVVDNDYLELAVCLFNIVAWYLLSQLLNRTSKLKALPTLIGNYGMDIYVFAYFVQIPIRVVLGTMLGLPYAIYATLMFVFGLFIPIPISKYIIRKVRLFRILTLGDFSKEKKD